MCPVLESALDREYADMYRAVLFFNIGEGQGMDSLYSILAI